MSSVHHPRETAGNEKPISCICTDDDEETESCIDGDTYQQEGINGTMIQIASVMKN